MAKQTQQLPDMCQHRSVCLRDATWGTYRFRPGHTDVDLNIPARVWCGQHKPRLDHTVVARNVPIRGIP